MAKRMAPSREHRWGGAGYHCVVCGAIKDAPSTGCDGPCPGANVPKPRSKKTSHPSRPTPPPPETWPEPYQPGEQMNHLVQCMETYTKHSIECWLCLKRDSTRDETDAKYARWLYEHGWRFQTTGDRAGVTCPECVKNPNGD